MYDGLGAEAALKIAHSQTLYLITLARYKLHLHFIVCADEKHFDIGHKLLEFSRNRNGRIDMTGSSAAGKDKFHICTFLSDFI